MTSDELQETYPRGTWVRFMRDGRLVIGEVSYVKRTTFGYEVITDRGVVDPDSVLELRQPGASFSPT